MKFLTDDGKIFNYIKDAEEHEKNLLPLDEYIEVQSKEIYDLVVLPDGEYPDDMDYIDKEFFSKLIELFTRMENHKLVDAIKAYYRLSRC
jgi:hypothetical protein